MATSSVAVTPGSGKNLATYSVSEDAVTKEISRVGLNTSAGVELLGQKAMAASIPMVLASDQSSVPVTPLNTTIAGKSSLGTTTPVQSVANFTITLASLANGSARQSTLISNSSNYPAAKIHLKITSGGSAPTAGTVYEVYLLRSDGTVADDGAGVSDAAITIENAPLLGTIVVTASTAKAFYGTFDTAPLGPLGSTWGIAVKNSTGNALSTTEGDHVKDYQYYNPSQA